MAPSGKSTSAPAHPPGRILAIDYGEKRIGLALSDELQLAAQPLQTLVRTNRRNDLRRLREIVRRNQVRRIVVGHPVHLDGAASDMSEEARRFARRIEKELGVPVDLADERLTSWEAHEMRAASPRKNRHDVDALAAALILRDYLARHANERAGARR